MIKKIIIGVFILSIVTLSSALSFKMNIKSNYAVPSSVPGTNVKVIKSFNKNAVGTGILTSGNLEASRWSSNNLDNNGMAAINNVRDKTKGNTGKIINTQIGTLKI
jgi:hypothetical protein